MKALLGYRKVAITLIVFFSSLGLLLSGAVSPENFIELNKFVIPAFLASNLVETWMNKRESKE